MAPLHRTSPNTTIEMPPASGVAAALEHGLLCIDVPSEEAGLGLIERLSPLHAELAPRSDGCCRVEVELRERTADAVVRVLDAVLAWAVATGIHAMHLELDGREEVVRP